MPRRSWSTVTRLHWPASPTSAPSAEWTTSWSGLSTQLLTRLDLRDERADGVGDDAGLRPYDPVTGDDIDPPHVWCVRRDVGEDSGGQERVLGRLDELHGH